MCSWPERIVQNIMQSVLCIHYNDGEDYVVDGGPWFEVMALKEAEFVPAAIKLWNCDQ